MTSWLRRPTEGSGAARWWLRDYRPASIRYDLVAALSTAAVVIPQAMAYAVIAGLPVEVGLYTASVPMAAYALAGTSRALSVSVTSAIAALTGAAVAASPDPQKAASTLALLSGICLLAASLLRLGFVADLISAPVLLGFKIGVGITIAVGQLGALLGVAIDGERMIVQLWSGLTSIPDANGATLGVSAACILVLVAIKRWLPKVPGPLLVVVASIAAARIWDLSDHGVELVGDVPSGLPSLALPDLGLVDGLLAPALGVALLAFVESIAAARAFQRADDPPVVADRELGALGIANVVSSVLRGMPAGGGMSQSAVNDGAGARSPLAAVGTGGVVVVTLLFLAPIFGDLPKAALGAVVLVAALGLVDVPLLRRIFSVQPRDGWLAVVAAAAVMAAGALYGILAAVIISVLTLMYETSRRGIEVVESVTAHGADTVQVPSGMLVIKIKGDLHFANVKRFHYELDEAIAAVGRPLDVIVLDASRTQVLEYTAQEAVRDIALGIIATGVDIWLIPPSGPAAAADIRFRRLVAHESGRTVDDVAAAVESYVERERPSAGS